jgi:tetratricopeptide (TPR) repeat protein
MAIEGPISELAATDLLQLLHLSRRSGALTASGGARGTITLFLEDGSLVNATSTTVELRLGRLLLGSGRITESQLEKALARQTQRSTERLGHILLEQGSASSLELESALRFQIDEAVLELMRWDEGYLRFEDLHPRFPGKVAIRASTDSVLMEAARRMDELNELVGSPSLDPLPVLAEGGETDSEYVHLSALDWEVLAEVDGRRTLRGIALSLSRPQLEVARSLYNLTASGVVELESVTADEGAGAMDLAVIASRIEAALEERRPEDAAAFVHRARGVAGAVDLLIWDGRVAALLNDWESAASGLQKALDLDPLRAEIHYHLGRIRFIQLDLVEAERALTRYISSGEDSERRIVSAVRMIDAIREVRKTAAESAP